MLLPGTTTPKTWLIFMVLIAFFALSETIDDHKLDIKLEFDIKQGSDGAPSLRIEKFAADSGNTHRRADDDSNESDRKAKAKPSSSDSDSDASSKENAKEPPKLKGGGSDSASHEAATVNIRSTKGARADDIGSEEGEPKMHASAKKQHSSAEDSSSGSSRR